MNEHENNAIATDELKFRALAMVDRTEGRIAQLVRLAVQLQAANPEITKSQAQPILDEMTRCEEVMHRMDELVQRFPQKVFTEAELLLFDAELGGIANER